MNDFVASNSAPAPPGVHADRIVVVGPCAAGKTTLANALRALGYNAHPCAQEHSVIATLWRHSQPDVLIALKADIGAVRSRRGMHWPAWLHETQLQRLANAYTAADLVIDTSTQDSKAVLEGVIAYLENRVRN
jgi:ABC-type molybdenum transport system ATPase subunit/photorepair protein PhrA